MTRRRLLRGLLGVALAGAMGYLALLLAVVRASREDQRHAADAIVVLGAAQYNGRPSAVLRARLDHAAILYRQGLAPYLVVTGGIGSGDRVSEATVGRHYLMQQGIPALAVVVRPEGRTTEASMASVAEWMHDREFSSALLVSDPFHMLRLRLEARDADITPWTSPTRTSPISEAPRREWAYFAAEALKVPVVWLRARWFGRASRATATP